MYPRINSIRTGTDPNYIPIINPRIIHVKARTAPNQNPIEQSPIPKANPVPVVSTQELIQLQNRITALRSTPCPETVAKFRVEQQRQLLNKIAEWGIQADNQLKLKIRFQRNARSLAKAKQSLAASFPVENHTEKELLPKVTQNVPFVGKVFPEEAFSDETPSETDLPTIFQQLGLDPLDVETEEWVEQMEKWDAEMRACTYSMSCCLRG
jgi:hypothetical protein